MITIQGLRSAFVRLLLAALIGRSVQTTGANDLHGLAASNTAFALDLYARLKAADGNLFFSPYSISTCLALTYAGARGDTAAQMVRTLHLGTNQNQLADSFGELQRQLNKVQEKRAVELDIANGLWAQKDHPFLPAFLDVARQKYAANLKQVDFRIQPETVRTEINNWVRHKTKDKITGLIPPGALDPTTRLVLVNAIYFKGQWALQFNKKRTTDAPFSVTPNRKLQPPFT